MPQIHSKHNDPSSLTASQSLSRQDLQRLAPPILATGAHHRVTSRYQFISTLDLIQGLTQEGWLPVHATESRARTEDRYQ